MFKYHVKNKEKYTLSEVQEILSKIPPNTMMVKNTLTEGVVINIDKIESTNINKFNNLNNFNHSNKCSLDTLNQETTNTDISSSKITYKTTESNNNNFSESKIFEYSINTEDLYFKSS